MTIYDHFLRTAYQVPSTNCDDRPDPDDISLVVIHCISLPPGQYGGNFIDQLFCNCLNPEEHPYFREIHNLRVSAHLLICRDGIVRQYVPFHRRAWHAGISEYQGRTKCNDFSIGIELEGAVDQHYTGHQYRQLANVVGTLLAFYPKLSKQHIVGHSDIAPNRKTDPGPLFDWTHFMALLA